MKELDSFIFKFKNLCSSGRNANLNMKCGSGKIEVHLSVELHEAHADKPLRPQARNGLARQRRREKRAAAREIAAAAEAIMEKAGAVEEPVTKPSDKEIVAEKVTLREATSDGSDATAKEAIENETCDENRKFVTSSALMKTFIMMLINPWKKVQMYSKSTSKIIQRQNHLRRMTTKF